MRVSGIDDGRMGVAHEVISLLTSMLMNTDF